MIEKLLIEHCSPTLASLKSANLCAVHYSCEQELEEQISYWNRQLKNKGITILLMKKKPGWALVYVCRKDQLQRRLHDAEAAGFLAYYSTDKDVYMITGLADKVDDIDSVRAIVNSIQLADHKKPATPAPKQEEKKQDPVVEKTGEMYTLFNEMGNSVNVYGYTDGTYRSDDGTLFQCNSTGDWQTSDWVDYYGNHYSTTGAIVTAEKTGVTYELTSESGALVVVYEYTDGSLRSDDGNLFQMIDGNEFVDYYGNHYFKDYIPDEYQDEDYQAMNRSDAIANVLDQAVDSGLFTQDEIDNAVNTITELENSTCNTEEETMSRDDAISNILGEMQQEMIDYGYLG